MYDMNHCMNWTNYQAVYHNIAAKSKEILISCWVAVLLNEISQIELFNQFFFLLCIYIFTKLQCTLTAFAHADHMYIIYIEQ